MGVAVAAVVGDDVDAVVVGGAVAVFRSYGGFIRE